MRARLETIAFREGDGGTYTPDICPGCGEDRKGKPWVGKRGDPDRMCERCFTAGKPLPGPVSALAKGSKRTAAVEGEASVGSGPKPKSPGTVRVYVLRPIHEKGKDYYPGASFYASPERAKRLAAPPNPERKLKVERRVKVGGKVYVLGPMIWPSAQSDPEASRPNLPLVSLTPPRPRTPTSSDFEALEERACGARLVQDIGYFMLDHAIDRICRQADAGELLQLNEALHGLFERHVKVFGHYKPRLAAAVAEAGRKTIVEWFMSGPCLAEEVPVPIKKGQRIPVPIKEGEGFPELVKRLADVQIRPSALKAQPGPRKTYGATDEASDDPLHLLVAYGVFRSLLVRVKALPQEQQLETLRVRLATLANCLGYSVRPLNRGDLAKGIFIGGKLVSPREGALFLLHHYIGHKKDSIRKSITKARRNLFAHLLNLT